MAKIKSYTDLEQSKKLANILPLESADMSYKKEFITTSLFGEPIYDYKVKPDYCKWSNLYESIPCWSLAALLEVVRNNGRYELQMYEGGYYFETNGFMTESYFNPVDACVEMILKLHENDLL